jgi:pimeloyl-ACP methyl ester carboxylesterase
MARIVFLHGLEGSSTGQKPTWLKSHGHTVVAPTLDTRALIAWLSTHPGGPSTAPMSTVASPRTAALEAITEFRPEVVVGSSFGGGLAMLLQQEGKYRGPLVLLAPAGAKLFGIQTLTTTAPVAVLHGRADEVVPVQDSIALAAGAHGDVTLRLVDDDHRLTASVATGLMGELVELVLHRR